MPGKDYGPALPGAAVRAASASMHREKERERETADICINVYVRLLCVRCDSRETHIRDVICLPRVLRAARRLLGFKKRTKRKRKNIDVSDALTAGR